MNKKVVPARNSNWLLTLGVAAVMCSALFGPVTNAQPPVPRVTIVNGADAPVPVTVGNDSPVAVTVGNESPIAVTGTVKNADAPGRVPWSTRSQILPAGGAGSCFLTSDCFNYVEGSTLATFDLPAVPAGKRWVVVSASGGMVNGALRRNQIELLNNRGGIIFDGLKWVFAGPFSEGTNSFSPVVYSEQLFATFEPGETPSVRVSVDSSSVLSGYAVLVFNGYLIDAE